ncbi:MAG: hypothetical protein U0359_15015 [Byssovorax sp.]
MRSPVPVLGALFVAGSLALPACVSISPEVKEAFAPPRPEENSHFRLRPPGSPKVVLPPPKAAPSASAPPAASAPVAPAASAPVAPAASAPAAPPPSAPTPPQGATP